MRPMGLLTEDPVPPGFTGTRIGVCNLCEAICGIELTIEDGQVTGIRGNEADPLSRGYICPKGVSMADVYDDPDRLRRPIRRVGRGAEVTWEEIDWDEALDLVADRLAAVATEHGGPDAVGVYLGNPNAHSARFRDPRRAVRQGAADPQPLQRVHRRPDPAPVRGLADVRAPAAAAGPRHRPHHLLPRPRCEPDGVQRVTDDGPRLPAARPRPQVARRPDGRARPAPHRDRQGRDRAPLRPPRLRRGRPPGDAARPARRGARHSPGVRRRPRPGRRAGRRLHPRARRDRERCSDRDDPAADPRLRGGRRRRGVRPDGPVDPGLRLGLPVGDQRSQPRHRQLRPRGRRAVPRAGRRHRRTPDRRSRSPRRLAEPGAADPRVRRRAARRQRCARRSTPPARGRSARWSRSPATPCSRRPTAPVWREPSRPSTSWSRSTST